VSAPERLGLVLAIALGALVRLLPIVWAESVVGDGGLFLAMVEDIRNGGAGLPTTTSYNDLDIPFVYPPVALLIAAFIGDVGGLATIDVLRWLPALVAIGCTVAVAVLAVEVLPRPAAVGATLAYALMPAAYGWLVAGGGLTRGIGLFFALLAAAVAARHRIRPVSWQAAVGCGVLLGLAFLSHPQAGIFGVLAATILSWRASMRSWLRPLAVAAVTTLLVLSPWLFWVAATSGIESLGQAAGRFEPLVGIVRMLNLRFTAALFMDVILVAGVVGLVVSLARRELRMPVLLAATYLVGAGGGEFLAAVPWSLLAGVGVLAVIDISARALAGMPVRTSRRFGALVGGVALLLALVGSLGSVADPSSKLHPLTAAHRQAMAWVERETERDAVVIVPSDEVWGFDDIGEWLPAISGRHSIGTVQGSEWLGPDAFERQLATHEAIQGCAGSVASCYRSIEPEAILFIPKGQLNGPLSRHDCCPALRQTLDGAGYEVIYDAAGATIARQR
jgi:multisubunit Na+/H+ antiporter MnhF subunit